MSKAKDRSDAEGDTAEPLLEQIEKTAIVVSATDESKNKLQPAGVKRNKSK